MTTMFSSEDAFDAIQAAIDAGKLKSGTWDACMMHYAAHGADSTEDCVTAGWPEWLVNLNITLFDATVGADNESTARAQFALDVTRALQQPRDMDATLLRFLILRLDDGEHSALKTLHSLKGDFTRQIEVVERVVVLLRRSLAGENVEAELKAAAHAYAADAAADAASVYAVEAATRAARAAARAYVADAAAYVADAAAYVARAAACVAGAVTRAAADAAADVAGAVTRAAGAAGAARAVTRAAGAAGAARADLITALNAS